MVSGLNQQKQLYVSPISYNNKRVISFCGDNFSTLNKDSFQLLNNSKQEFSIAAMAPLQINNDVEMAKFVKDIQAAKANGVGSISVDVWWGLAEKSGEGKFDWNYYEKVFKTIKENGLKITPILSMHKCGGNIGDTVNIPLPDWSWDYLSEKLGINSTAKDSALAKSIKQKMKTELQYKNEHGDYVSDAIPIWYDEVMMPKYRQFIDGFKEHFISNPDSNVNIKDCIQEINVSCGPAGELRYPTYGSMKGGEFPNRGALVGYDMGGKASFKNYMANKYGNNIARLNYEWGTKLKSFNQILPPHNNTQGKGRATGFIEAKNYVNTQYGKDYTEWYHNTLLKHGENLLINAHESFKDTDIPIGFKFPGVHWQMANENTPRIAEITTGIIDTNITKENDYGYKSLFDMIKSVKDKYKNSDTITHFTCLELDNDLGGVYNGRKNNSCAKNLVEWIVDVAKSRGLTIKGENADAGHLLNENRWNTLKNNIWRGFDGITFLRVGNLNNNENFKNFMNWIKGDLVKKGEKVLMKVA